MSEYRGNALAELEAAIITGRKGHTLTAEQIRQVLEVVGGLTEAKNVTVRENIELIAERDAARRVLLGTAERLAVCSELLGRHAEKKRVQP